MREQREADQVDQPRQRRRVYEVGPDELGGDHVLDQPGRGHGQERQHRRGQAGHDPRGEQAKAPRPARREQPDHGQRHQGPQLDGHGAAERRAAPGQPAALGQLIAVEHQQRADQAEQVQPGFEQERLRRNQGVRVHRVNSAGDPRGRRASMPDEQAEQGDAGGVRGRGEQPRDGQARRAAGRLGQQCHRRYQQNAPRRLHDDEVPVRDHAADQAHGVAELDAVVILGHAEQVARPGQLVEPQERRGGRAYRDHRVHQPWRLDPAQREACLRRAGHGDAITSGHGITFCSLRCSATSRHLGLISS